MGRFAVPACLLVRDSTRVRCQPNCWRRQLSVPEPAGLTGGPESGFAPLLAQGVCVPALHAQRDQLAQCFLNLRHLSLGNGLEPLQVISLHRLIARCRFRDLMPSLLTYTIGVSTAHPLNPRTIPVPLFLSFSFSFLSRSIRYVPANLGQQQIYVYIASFSIISQRTISCNGIFSA